MIVDKLINLKHTVTKKCYLKIFFADMYIGLVNKTKIKKEELMTLSGLKTHIGQTELSKNT